MRNAIKLSPAQMVDDAVANSRLDGFAVSEETRAVMHRVAIGEMDLEQLEAWENEQAERLHQD